jgi:hypothetical protein
MTSSADGLGAMIAASLADWQPRALASDAARARLRALLAPCPTTLSSLFGFECRLGEAAAEADFAVCIGRRPGEAESLAAWAAAQGDTGVWPRLARLAAALQADAAPMHNCWLEFDVAGAPVAIPSVFVGSRNLTRTPQAPGGGLAASCAWLGTMVALLRGEEALPAALECHIAAVLAALPPGASMYQVGAMTARAGAPVRLCLRGLPMTAIPGFLARAGWRGEVEQALTRLAGMVDDVRLGLDVTEAGIGPRLGLECYLNPDARLAKRLPALVAALIARGLCLEANGIGLLAWPGLTHERRHAAIWPASLRAGAPGEGNLFRRWVHHVKVTLEPGGKPTAKAYLAAANETVRDATLRAAIAAAVTDQASGAGREVPLARGQATRP